MFDANGKSKPVRVLQVIGIVCGGGVENVIMNYYRHMDRGKVQFDFIIDGKDKSILDDEIQALGGCVYHVTSYKENIFRYVYEIYRILNNHKYEIIHDNMNTLSLFSLFPAWLSGLRVRIIHNHTTNAIADGEKIKYIIKKITRPLAPIFANHYFACSRYAAEWMYGRKNIRGEVKIINNAIDTDRFAYSSNYRHLYRQKLNASESTVVIGHVGRMVPVKNHMFLLDVFSRYLQINPHAILVLIGDGPLRQQIEQRARDLGVDDKVYMLGLIKEVNEWYSAMDVFVLPSMYEGLSVVTVEAQANGLPICVSEAVPTEAVFNANVMRLPLSTADIWCRAIIDYVRLGRIVDNSTIKEAGFSIDIEVKKLECWYLKNIKND